MWFNPIMKWLLKSPLHFIVSGNMMLLTFRGRVSGRTYATPVGYLAVDEVLYTISSRDRVWWRNFRGGAEAQFRLAGREVTAQGSVVEDVTGVESELLAYLGAAPERAKYLGVQMGEDKVANAEDVRRLAEEKVIVKWKLEGEARVSQRDPAAQQDLAQAAEEG